MKPSHLEFLRCPRSDQPLELEPTVVSGDGSIRYGTLTAQGFSYPIVQGIPILVPGADGVVELVRAERFREATVSAALGDVERSRLLPFVDGLSSLRGTGRVCGAVATHIRRRQIARDVRQLFGQPPGEDLVTDPLRLLFLSRRQPIEEGYNYFRYRFGTPRFLVGLALLDALPPAAGPVVDVGCGAGHFTWALTQRHVATPVLGVDLSFGQLLAAARIAPDAGFICGDSRALPLRSDAFHRVLSSDVLPYVTEKATAARELVRLLVDNGYLVLTALRNSLQRHVHGGEPLEPAAWEALVDGLEHRKLIADDAILDRYMDGMAPGGLTGKGIEESQTVSVVAGHEAPSLQEGAWAVWPHAVGPLAPHPLLQTVSSGGEGTAFERRFPSKTYEVDNGRIAEYLPANCVIPPEFEVGCSVHDLQAGPVDELISAVAILGLPRCQRLSSSSR